MVDKCRFSLGQTVMTTNALRTLHPEDVFTALVRHERGDWGEVCEEDKAANEQSLKDDARLFSIYTDRNGNKFWIITEADRSVTTVLLPEDY